MNFREKLDFISKKNNSLLCVGLDSDIEKIPESIRVQEHPQFTFNKKIIDATAQYVCAYKPNSAFYEARGIEGIYELRMTCEYIQKAYPEIVIIVDAKRGDIGNTNKGYVEFIYDYLGADGVTLHPYLGKEVLLPFLQRREKGSFILCRTSNPGAGEFQDLLLGKSQPADALAKEESTPLYQIIADHVAKEWNGNGNCGLVVGATYSSELEIVRRIVGDGFPLLIPGIGAQGGDVEQSVKTGVDKDGMSAIINSSRGIIFASSNEDFDTKASEEAKKLKDEMNKFR